MDDNLFHRSLFSLDSSIMFCKKCFRYVEARTVKIDGKTQCYCPLCYDVMLVFKGDDKNGSTRKDHEYRIFQRI